MTSFHKSFESLTMKDLRNNFLLCFLLVFIVLLSSCTSSKKYHLYEGPELPEGSTAILLDFSSAPPRVYKSGGKTTIYRSVNDQCLLELDGKRIESRESIAESREFILLPGKHTIIWMAEGWGTCFKMAFTAEAGRKYAMTYKVEERTERLFPDTTKVKKTLSVPYDSIVIKDITENRGYDRTLTVSTPAAEIRCPYPCR